MNRHLKQHVMFYLGLAQIIAGFVASVDIKTLTWSSGALAVSGLLMLVGKYVQQAPDTSSVPTLPVTPAQSGEVK